MHQLSDKLKAIYIWLLDKIVTRDLLRTYEGDGNFTEECGWWILGRWWISHAGAHKKGATKRSRCKNGLDSKMSEVQR